MKTAKGGIYKDIYEGIMSDPDYNIVPPGEIGFSLVKERDNFALISDATWLRRGFAEDCGISLIRETFYKTGFGFALPEGSPYKIYFDEM